MRVTYYGEDSRAEGSARGDERTRTIRIRRAATEFTFDMPQPIPSYLIALAVGDLRFQAVSKRTGVWAEPSVLNKAASGTGRHGEDGAGSRAAVWVVSMGAV